MKKVFIAISLLVLLALAACAQHISTDTQANTQAVDTSAGENPPQGDDITVDTNVEQEPIFEGGDDEATFENW